jgi:hypothetical protein
MFKRLFWMMVGIGIGFGFSFWLTRAVRQTMQRYSPEQVADRFTDALRGLGTDLRAAVSEGRQAMREREVELRTEIGSRRPA